MLQKSIPSILHAVNKGINQSWRLCRTDVTPTTTAWTMAKSQSQCNNIYVINSLWKSSCHPSVCACASCCVRWGDSVRPRRRETESCCSEVSCQNSFTDSYFCVSIANLNLLVWIVFEIFASEQFAFCVVCSTVQFRQFIRSVFLSSLKIDTLGIHLASCL